MGASTMATENDLSAGGAGGVRARAHARAVEPRRVACVCLAGEVVTLRCCWRCLPMPGVRRCGPRSTGGIPCHQGADQLGPYGSHADAAGAGRVLFAIKGWFVRCWQRRARACSWRETLAAAAGAAAAAALAARRLRGAGGLLSRRHRRLCCSGSGRSTRRRRSDTSGFVAYAQHWRTNSALFPAFERRLVAISRAFWGRAGKRARGLIARARSRLCCSRSSCGFRARDWCRPQTF